MVGVSVLLDGTGAIAGIIKASALQYDVINILEAMNMPTFVLAPLAGILMAGATASTTGGAVNMSIVFCAACLKEGLIKSTRPDWRANLHAPRGKKSQEYFVYFKIF